MFGAQLCLCMPLLISASTLIRIEQTPYGAPTLLDGTADSSEKIPKLVIFTGHSEPKQVVEANRHMVEPNTEFRYYNDQQMKSSVKKISSKLSDEVGLVGAYDAFLTLRPMAFRADLWRYMVLWDAGGLYLDDKLVLKKETSSWLNRHKDTIYTCFDEEKGKALFDEQHKRMYWNALIAAKPRHPGLLEVIRDVVDTIQNRRYPPKRGPHFDLFITGPGVFGQGLRKASADVTSVGVHRYIKGVGESVVDSASTPLLVVDESVHNETQHNRMADSAWQKLKGKSPYGELAGDHAVYCDEPAIAGVYDPCHEPSLVQVEPENYWSVIAGP